MDEIGVTDTVVVVVCREKGVIRVMNRNGLQVIMEWQANTNMNITSTHFTQSLKSKLIIPIYRYIHNCLFFIIKQTDSITDDDGNITTNTTYNLLMIEIILSNNTNTSSYFYSSYFVYESPSEMLVSKVLDHYLMKTNGTMY